MTDEQKQVIQLVIDAWDKANDRTVNKWDEAVYQAFCEAGAVDPLRRLVAEVSDGP